MPEQPQLSFAAKVIATVGEPVEISASRRLIPITAGHVRGPRLHGEILDGGVDYQFIRPSGVAELQARYVIKTETGELIYVENNALRHGSPDAMERLKQGRPVDPSEIYFRGAVRFETAAPAYEWLTKHLFIALGARFPDRVEIDVYQLL